MTASESAKGCRCFREHGGKRGKLKYNQPLKFHRKTRKTLQWCFSLPFISLSTVWLLFGVVFGPRSTATRLTISLLHIRKLFLLPPPSKAEKELAYITADGYTRLRSHMNTSKSKSHIEAFQIFLDFDLVINLYICEIIPLYIERIYQQLYL